MPDNNKDDEFAGHTLDGEFIPRIPIPTKPLDTNELFEMEPAELIKTIQEIDNHVNMYVLDRVIDHYKHKILLLNTIISLKILVKLSPNEDYKRFVNETNYFTDIISASEKKIKELQDKPIQPTLLPSVMSQDSPPGFPGFGDNNLNIIPIDPFSDKTPVFGTDLKRIFEKAQDSLPDIMSKNPELVDMQMSRAYGDLYFRIKDKLPVELKEKALKFGSKIAIMLMNDPSFDLNAMQEGMEAWNELSAKVSQLVEIEKMKEQEKLK